MKHIRLRHQNNDVTPRLNCSLCAQTFQSEKTLKVHLKHHDRKKNFICELCSEAFVTEFKLKVHTKKTHEKIKCRYSNCNFEGMYTEVEKHEHNRHRSGKQAINFVCEQCGKNFKSRKGANKHKKYHNKLENIENDLDPSFRNSSNLQSTRSKICQPSTDPAGNTTQQPRYTSHLREEQSLLQPLRNELEPGQYPGQYLEPQQYHSLLKYSAPQQNPALSQYLPAQPSFMFQQHNVPLQYSTPKMPPTSINLGGVIGSALEALNEDLVFDV